ncbi:restriction endonuclease [Massilia eburnea]|uniref:restriction endonuclease n=1 Tax=Massilia eburnea TaxID=1776165 RepID=UPI003D6B6537
MKRQLYRHRINFVGSYYLDADASFPSRASWTNWIRFPASATQKSNLCDAFNITILSKPIRRWQKDETKQCRPLQEKTKGHMATNWKDYQEEAAALFRSMGLSAETDVTLQGVRTSHDVDVVVQSVHAGFEVTWLVECKFWKTPVSKLHVLALREIVADLGADRGILLCEAGFQSGAIEAANLTSVQVTNLERVRVTAGGDILAMRLRELYDRIESCRQQYWEMSKGERIKHGLRDNGWEYGYSGARTVELCVELITKAFRGTYPFLSDSHLGLIELGPDKVFRSAEDVLTVVAPKVEELEMKIQSARGAIAKGN